MRNKSGTSEIWSDEKKGFSGPIHVVFGNNDADLYRITQQAEHNRMAFYGEPAELVVQNERLIPFKEADPNLQSKRIAVNHFNYLARPMAASGKYEVRAMQDVRGYHKIVIEEFKL